MISGTINHFPPLVFNLGKKALWNRIEKKPLSNRPEERVRLRYIDYLTLECEWPATRIATELSVENPVSNSSLRADIICFGKTFDPEILIECKAESVALNQKSALQIATYNRTVQAKLLCITNGVEDFWYEVDKGKIDVLQHSPVQTVNPHDTLRKDRSYWLKRGFTGNREFAGNSDWIVETLCSFWSDQFPYKSAYLDIHHQIPELQFDHYYKLADTGNETRIAISFLSSQNGDTFMTAIYNQDGQNRALLISNLNKTAGGVSDNSSMISGNGRTSFDIRKNIPFNFRKRSPEVIDNLPGFLESLFRQKL